MKQANKYKRYIGRKEAHEAARNNLIPQYKEGMKQNVSGVSLKKVDKSMKYEDNPQRLIQQLRFKGIIINDGPTTLHIEIKKDHPIMVPPAGIFVGLGKDIGNKTRGKIDFLIKYMRYTCWGWSYLK